MINPINECKLFDTPTTYGDLIDWCERHTGTEKIVAVVAAHMALNLAHHIVQNAIDANTTTNDE